MMKSKGCFPAAPIVLFGEQRSSCQAIEALLRDHGYDNFLTFADAAGVEQVLGERPVATVLLDLTTPATGNGLLKRICCRYPQVPAIVLADADAVDAAVRCIKLGAFDYIVKPTDAARLATVVKNALAASGLREQNRALREQVLDPQLHRRPQFADIVTNSENLFTLFRYMEAIAATSDPVLITGEPGAGKTLLARTLHRLSGRDGEFVAVNVDGLNDRTFADALFGGRGGAGAIDQATGGSLYLNEVGKLQPASQTTLMKLLEPGARVLSDDGRGAQNLARVMASTARDLWRGVREERFRNDLNFSLREHHLHVPPLRERRADIPLLVEHFVAVAAAENGGEPLKIPETLWEPLSGYHFPGNVGELQLMTRTAVSMSKGRTLELAPFIDHIRQARQNDVAAANGGTAPSGAKLRFQDQLPTLKEAADLLLLEALQRANGNQSIAGRMLGISQQAVSKRLKVMSQHV